MGQLVGDNMGEDILRYDEDVVQISEELSNN